MIVARFQLTYLSQMGRQEARPDPRETIKIIDALVKQGFDDAQFRPLHHLGASLAGFRSYCSKVQSFIPAGRNHELHIRLRKLLDSY
jgi:hypothetical protein